MLQIVYSISHKNIKQFRLSENKPLFKEEVFFFIKKTHGGNYTTY